MDVDHYRRREAVERQSAASAVDPSARKAHLELAESYRQVIEAYERLQSIRDQRAAE